MIELLLYMSCSVLAVLFLGIIDGYYDLKVDPNGYLICGALGPVALVIMFVAALSITGTKIGRYFKNDK